MFNFYKFKFCKFRVNDACSVDVGIDKHLSVPLIEKHQKLMDIHQVTLNNEHTKTIFSIPLIISYRKNNNFTQIVIIHGKLSNKM
ncbi:unnamed protein product [Schistosoma margrebowiei]|uniref:Uncharacterized protein n=1 Tax=Schistosoma margrebowiei TaxID=48269 RepID=A0AA84ZQJ9_9TREM|nr:unnamed protein product [Schistosoma margrebowiei]